MIYTELTKKAMKICFQAHKDQQDRSGLPYVFHPFHLAEQMETEETAAAALLHDVMEDTDWTAEDLEREEIPSEVIHALKLLTHDPDEPYMEYVCRAGCNPIARAVKLADLTHNSDLTRLDHVTEADQKRVQKYQTAIQFLQAGRTKGLSDEQCESRIQVKEHPVVGLTMIAVEDKVLRYDIDVGAEDDYYYKLSPEAVQKLNSLIGDGETSFAENLEDFCKNHEPYEVERILRDNDIEFEMMAFY